MASLLNNEPSAREFKLLINLTQFENLDVGEDKSTARLGNGCGENGYGAASKNGESESGECKRGRLRNSP